MKLSDLRGLFAPGAAARSLPGDEGLSAAQRRTEPLVTGWNHLVDAAVKGSIWSITVGPNNVIFSLCALAVSDIPGRFRFKTSVESRLVDGLLQYMEDHGFLLELHKPGVSDAYQTWTVGDAGGRGLPFRVYVDQMDDVTIIIKNAHVILHPQP